MSSMKLIFNVVSLTCLAIGLSGILWCGDWRLLLSFPVAFGIGLMRGFVRSTAEEVSSSSAFAVLLPVRKLAFASSVFLTFTFVYFTGASIRHFTVTPDEVVWAKACWFAGLLLQPWLWRWRDARDRADALAVFALSVPCAALMAVFPKFADVCLMVETLLLVPVLIIVGRRMNRKEVAA